MEKAKSFETIVTNLNILRYIIVSKVRNGLYDVNKRSEDFFKGLLNLVYDWELENLNKETLTYPGIDLGSKKDKIAIQVTSQPKREKTERTIALFDEHSYSDTYDRLIMFNITSKVKHSKEFEPKTINFDKEKDMLDIDDVLTFIERNVQTPKIKQIETYIKQEIPYYVNTLTNSKDLLSELNDYKNIKAKNYNRVKRYLGEHGNMSYFSDFIDAANKEFDKLHQLSQKQRIGLIPILTKGKSDCELLISTWGNTLENSFYYPKQEIRDIGHALMKANLIYDDEDETSPSFSFIHKDFWRDILEILKDDSDIMAFVVDLKFSLLDE